MHPVISSGKYILSVTTTAGTYYLGPLQDTLDTLGVVVHDDIDPLPTVTFTLIDDGAVDEYKISIGELYVDKMRDGSLCLEADNGRCKKWRIVPSGNETYMIKGGDDSCWSSPRFQAQKQAGFPVMDANGCKECSKECKCNEVDSQGEKNGCDHDKGSCPACQPTSGGNTASVAFPVAAPLCTVCPPSCLAIKFVRV